MNERAIKWQPVPDIDHGFGSISFTYGPEESRVVSVLMRGSRNLCLRFTGVIALHFEDECPGNFPIPKELPMLRTGVTFPLLQIENSHWHTEWPMYSGLVHFVLISSDDLVHLITRPNVEVSWEQ